ncbi:MAG: type II toxin-antitoxin system VapB family antitoxin [Acidobacteria bacterium]|nr:type II toxin-antitoxin system VapB family antitoxin [Acidobacteriota bacterium]
MRTNIVLDDALVDEAMELTGARTKKEVVHRALEELVSRRRRKDLTELAGRIDFAEDFDHKKARELR